MPTKKVKLQAILEWAKVFEENRDMKGYEGAFEDHDGACTIDALLDEENFQKLRSSNSMSGQRAQADENGRYRVKFKRKWVEQYGGGAPIVKTPEGKTWDFDEDGTIGNGSEGEIVLTVYTTSRKNIVGTRLDKVLVTNLVKYEPEDDDGDTPAPKAEPVKEKLDDEIPFDLGETP